MRGIFGQSIALAACLALTSPALAQEFENSSQTVEQLRKSDLPDLGNGKAYIVYETVEGKYDIFFLRSLTEAELERFFANRAEALAEERARLREKREGAPGVSDEELLPDEAFNYVDPEILNLVRLDSGRVFSKLGQTRTYVVEVPEGEYTVFGAGLDGFVSGTCMCMGSVRFEAKAGELTDLGAVLVAPEDGKTQIEELAPYEAPEYIRRKALPYVMAVRPASLGDPMPPALDGMKVVPAQYNAADKFLNFKGMLINRMPPMEGVLRYDRDAVIDVRAELAAAEEARVKAEAVAAAESNLAQARAKATQAAAKLTRLQTEQAVPDGMDVSPELQAQYDAATSAVEEAEAEVAAADEALAAVNEDTAQ